MHHILAMRSAETRTVDQVSKIRSLPFLCDVTSDRLPSVVFLHGSYPVFLSLPGETSSKTMMIEREGGPGGSVHPPDRQFFNPEKYNVSTVPSLQATYLLYRHFFVD
jgi:hypothetical protein